MYIKDIGWGSKDNKRSFQCIYWDMDTYPMRASSGAHNPITPTVSSDNVSLSFSPQLSAVSYSGNAEVIEMIKAQMGPITNPKYAVFPKVDFENSHMDGDTLVYSHPRINFEEVELTEEPPENWEIDRWQYYYYIIPNVNNYGDFYANLRLYGASYDMFDWATLRAQFIANNQKLYKNTDVTKWVYVGSGDKQVMFMATKRGAFVSSSNNYTYLRRPDTVIYKRECYITSGGITKHKYGGYPRVSVDVTPESPEISSWTLQDDDYTLIGNQGLNAFVDSTGRYAVRETNPNPICDCTLMMFGFIVYNGRKYFGAFKFAWEPEYYWGYKRQSGSTGDWRISQLDLDQPVSYDELPETIRQFQFTGICLDELDVSVETGDGDIPEERPSSFIYPSIPLDLVGDRSLGLLAEGNSHGFHVYYMEADEFQDLTERLWNWGRFVKQAYDLIENHSLLDIASMWLNGSIQYGIVNQASMNPTNCVVFARKMPSFIGRAASSTKYNVFIGGNYQDNLQSYIMEWEIVEKGANLLLLFDKPTESFLDFAPYTEATLYLPYIGQIPIDPCVCAGGKIEISYVADIMSGLCSVLVRTEVERLGEHRQVRYGPYTGDCSLMVPIAMADSNSMQRNQAAVKAAVAGAAGLVGAESIGSAPQGELVAGDISRTAATQFIGRTGLNAAGVAMTPRTAGMITNLGNNTGTMCPWDVVLQIRSSAPYMFNETAESLGLKCYKVGKLKDFKGFSLIDWIDFKDFDFSTYAMTETEEEMIVRILKGGVFL